MAPTLADYFASANAARVELREMEEIARFRTVRAVEAARKANWTWERIGEAFGMSDNGARRFYERNRREG